MKNLEKVDIIIFHHQVVEHKEVPHIINIKQPGKFFM